MLISEKEENIIAVLSLGIDYAAHQLKRPGESIADVKRRILRYGLTEASKKDAAEVDQSGKETQRITEEVVKEFLMYLISKLRRHLMTPLDRAFERLPHIKKLKADPWVSSSQAAQALNLTRRQFTEYVGSRYPGWQRGIHWDDRPASSIGSGKVGSVMCYNLLLIYMEQIYPKNKYGVGNPLYVAAVERQRKINTKEHQRSNEL